MQHADDPDLAAALASPDVTMSGRVEFDWLRDGLYNHEYTDLSWLLTSAVLEYPTLVGDLPEEVNPVTGFSSAQLTMTLGGAKYGDADLDAAWDAELREQGLAADQLFSPYWRDSPLYEFDIKGTPVRYSRVVETAAGERVVRQFTGWVRSTPIDREANTVTVVCSDVEDIRRELVTFPHWCIRPPNVDDPGTSAGQMAGAVPGSLAWAVEETLRQGGRPTGPAAREDAVMYASCNGLLLPSVGNYAWSFGSPQLVRHAIAYDPGVWQWQEGKFGLCLKPLLPPYNSTRRSNSWINCARAVTVPAAGSGGATRKIGMSMWFQSAGGSAVGNPSYVTLFMDDWWVNGVTGNATLFVDSNGRITVQLTESGALTGTRIWVKTYDAALAPAGWHYVNAMFTVSSTSVQIDVHLDDSPVTAATSSMPAAGFRYLNVPPAFRPNLVELRASAAPIQHVQIYDGDATLEYQLGQGYPPEREAMPLALPYHTFTELQWIPDVVERPAWDLLQEIVKGEFGVVHTNEHGQIIALSHPRMRQEALDQIAGGNLLTIDDDKLLSLIIDPSLDHYANTMTGGAVNRYAVFKHVYTNPGPLDYYVSPGDTLERVISFDEAVTVDARINGVSATQPPNGPDIRISSVSAVRADNVNVEHPNVPGIGGGISVDLRFPDPDQPDARSALVRWWVNAGWAAAYLGSYIGGNSSSFHLSGLAYSERNTHRTKKVDAAEVALRGTRAVDIGDSDWRQTKGSVDVILENLLKDTVQPAPLVEPITIPADPRIQLRDVIRLTNEGGITGALFAQVIGINRRDDASGSVDTLALRIVRTPGVALWDDPDLGWDVGTWGE
ncbi:hypothetical protein BAY59_31195 [Prauserella coralliicola]|nr:hypothetical protein BAY59_31195 [Prauserella coralliicola]